MLAERGEVIDHSDIGKCQHRGRIIDLNKQRDIGTANLMAWKLLRHQSKARCVGVLVAAMRAAPVIRMQTLDGLVVADYKH